MSRYLMGLCFLLLGNGVLNAAPITWQLQSVTLQQGALSGSFTYDADAGPNGTYSNWSFTVPSALTPYGLVAETLTPATSIIPSGFTSHSVEFVDSLTSDYVALYFFNALTNSGGTDLFVPSQGWAGNFAKATPLDFVTGGSAVQSVPEPSTAVQWIIAMVIFAVRSGAKRWRAAINPHFR